MAIPEYGNGWKTVGIHDALRISFMRTVNNYARKFYTQVTWRVYAWEALVYEDKSEISQFPQDVSDHDLLKYIIQATVTKIQVRQELLVAGLQQLWYLNEHDIDAENVEDALEEAKGEIAQIDFTDKITEDDLKKMSPEELLEFAKSRL